MKKGLFPLLKPGWLYFKNSTLKANKNCFLQNKKILPKKAITLGIGTILKAKKILLLANGKKKYPIINKLVKSRPTKNLPASFLKLHSDITVMVDKEAYRKTT